MEEARHRWSLSLSCGTHPKPVVTASHAEEDRHEREPDDAYGVHGEADVFGFVEVLRDASCFDCVERTGDDQDHVVHERTRQVFVIGLTDENQTPLVVLDFGLEFHRGWRDAYPDEHADQLDAHDAATDAQLGARRKTRGLNQSLAVVEDSRQTIGFR